jgi:Protein of unknown function (DUF1045)
LGAVHMTDRFQRYAIYWTPEPGSDFASFGDRWFGPAAESLGLDPSLAARAVRSPARYGLHATLKAPFRLRDGIHLRDLQNALDSFCASRRGPSGGALTLGTFQNYLGLVLSARAADIGWLAAECVTHFDRFRAPLNGDDRDRRAEASFSPVERAFFESYGYPYVLSAFRFHISLAGPLPPSELNEVSAALAPQLAPFMATPFRLGSLSLLGEPHGGGIFEPVSRHPFRHSPAAEPEQERKKTFDGAIQ